MEEAGTRSHLTLILAGNVIVTLCYQCIVSYRIGTCCVLPGIVWMRLGSFWIYLSYCFLYMCVLLACTCVHPMSACACIGQRRMSDWRYRGVCGYRTKILCRSNKCVKLLPQRSSLGLELGFVWRQGLM